MRCHVHIPRVCLPPSQGNETDYKRNKQVKGRDFQAQKSTAGEVEGLKGLDVRVKGTLRQMVGCHGQTDNSTVRALKRRIGAPVTQVGVSYSFYDGDNFPV